MADNKNKTATVYQIVVDTSFCPMWTQYFLPDLF